MKGTILAPRKTTANKTILIPVPVKGTMLFLHPLSLQNVNFNPRTREGYDLSARKPKLNKLGF